MSESKDTGKRQPEREPRVDKRAKAAEAAEQERKQGRRLAYGFLVIVLILGVLTVLVNTNILSHNMTAVTIDGDKYTAVDVSFFYNTEYTRFSNENSNSMSALIDRSKPLETQECLLNPEMTWSEYFLDLAFNTMKQVTMLTRLAEQNGFSLPEEYYADIDALVANLEMYYSLYGYPNVQNFLAANYGKGATEKTLRAILEKTFLAEAYAKELRNSYEYSSSQLDEWYEAYKDTYDIITYRSQFVYADMEGLPELPDLGLEESPEDQAIRDEMTLERMTAAYELALAYTEVESEDAFKELAFNSLDEYTQEMYADYDFTLIRTEGIGLTESAEVNEWLLSPDRVPGETSLLEYDDGYQVVYFVGRNANDYEMVNVRHILIKSADLELLPEQMLIEAKEKAEAILEEWRSGPATEESFAELANEHSEDAGSNTNGGLYEKIGQGQMVPEFDAFCFDPERKPGDTAIVFGENAGYKGYHVMYYSGTAGLYKDLLAQAILGDEDYQAWQSAEIEKMPAPVTGFAMRLVG